MQRIRVAQLLVRTTIRISRSGTQRWNSSSSSGAQPAMTDGEQHIINKLTGRFKPSRLQVQDVSGGCGTFYAIAIKSSAFNGLSTLKQHRLVTEELKDEVASIHGLQLKTIPE